MLHALCLTYTPNTKVVLLHVFRQHPSSSVTFFMILDALSTLRQLDGQKKFLNPNLEIIEQLISYKFRGESKSKGMIMVEMRKYAHAFKVRIMLLCHIMFYEYKNFYRRQKFTSFNTFVFANKIKTFQLGLVIIFGYFIKKVLHWFAI